MKSTIRTWKKIIVVLALLLNASALLIDYSGSSSDKLLNDTEVASISALQINALLQQYYEINHTASVQQVLSWLVEQGVEQFNFAQVAELEQQMVTQISTNTYLDNNLNAIILLPSVPDIALVISQPHELVHSAWMVNADTFFWLVLVFNLVAICYLLMIDATTIFSRKEHTINSQKLPGQATNLMGTSESSSLVNHFDGLAYQDLAFGVCEVNLATEIINFNVAFQDMVDLPTNLTVPIKQDVLWHATAIYEFQPTAFPAVSNPFTVNALNGNSYILQYYAQDSKHRYLMVRTNYKGSYISQKKLWVNHLRHELSTPLSIMDLVLQTMQRDKPEQSTDVERELMVPVATLDTFSTAVNRIKLLTATLDRIDTNNIDEVALPEVALTQVIENAKSLLTQNDAHFDVITEGKEIWIGNSGPSLSTILLNLFDNALKHNEAMNVSIRVASMVLAGADLMAQEPNLKLLTNDDVLLIKVMDNGQPIDTATIDRLGWFNIANISHQPQLKSSQIDVYDVVAVDRTSQLAARRVSGIDICAQLCLRLSGMLLYKCNRGATYPNEFLVIIPKPKI